MQEQRLPGIWRRLFHEPTADGAEFASMNAMAAALASANFPFVAMAAGASPIVDRNDRVLGGGEVFLADGTLVCPQVGKASANAGPFAIMHKPHSAVFVPTDFFLCRTDLLRLMVASTDPVGNLAGLGIGLGLLAHRRGPTIAYPALVKAMATWPMIDGDSREIAPLARRTIGSAACLEMGRAIRGATGFLEAGRRARRFRSKQRRSRAS